ncbi:uncharacterized protein N7518_001480 [Penicillium psychrosexuale]|uniref:uncharacterized protein n=1 Tax=Penicillium psychrosexuale TaxID=1002107 RepID=UPI0025454DDD|nr:uncharacterized protein N7518_001480 [Penicillium psychrosexuale]KAJ5799412.1 hypothetical protein N7518_001480 [Penicillium psychrosexuale]
MSQVIPRASWLSLIVVALLAVSTVNAHPVHQADEEMEKGHTGKLESRSPRLIPDTQKYVHDILQGLGLEEPTSTSTSTPTATPTASVKTKQDSESMNPTKTTEITYSSSTSYTPTYSGNSASYTHTVKNVHSYNRPVENVQLGHGWNGDKKVTVDDLPAAFDALYKVLEHRLKDAIDSSDEIGLDEFL